MLGTCPASVFCFRLCVSEDRAASLHQGALAVQSRRAGQFLLAWGSGMRLICYVTKRGDCSWLQMHVLPEERGRDKGFEVRCVCVPANSSGMCSSPQGPQERGYLGSVVFPAARNRF